MHSAWYKVILQSTTRLLHVTIQRSSQLFPNRVSKRRDRDEQYGSAQGTCSNAESETARKELKAKNNAGNPVKLQSKILAVIPDPRDTASIFIAESAGTARRLALDVGTEIYLHCFLSRSDLSTFFSSLQTCFGMIFDL